MSTIADLVQELRELGIGLHEIQIPYRWYREIIARAEELAETGEETEDEDVY